MTPETPHTPTPWTTTKVGYIYGPDVVVARCGDFGDKELKKFSGERWNADAAFIVLAVNSHALLVEQVETLKKENEIERMRVAACATAALGNTPESVSQRIAPGHPYYSASYGDVCRAVDSEMDLRSQLVALVEALTEALAHVSELRDAWARGVISEHDGGGGTRSNRNVDVESALRVALQQHAEAPK